MTPLELRQRAQAVWQATAVPHERADLTPEAVQAMLHELQVHQIELGLQNEELRRVNDALEASRARYVDLYDQAPVGCCSVTEAGLISQANLTLATMLGVARSAVVGQAFSRFVLPHDQDVFYQMRKRLLAQAATQSCELRLLKPDGQAFWTKLLATTATGEDGEAEIEMAVSDITERRQAQEQLLGTAKFRDAILDSIASQIAVLDRDGTILAVNQTWRQFALDNSSVPGIPARDTQVGANYLAVCKTAIEADADPDAAAALHGILSVINRSAARFSHEYSCHSPEQQRWFSMVVTPLSLDHLAVVVTHTDITQRKHAEAERRAEEERQRLTAERLVELSRRLVQAQEHARRQLARELHELTSPNLAALRINLAVLAKVAPAQREEQDFIDRVADTQALLDDSTSSIRDICAVLHATDLEGGGMVGVVQNYARQFAKRTGLRVMVHCTHSEVHLAPTLALPLFRIVQEALTNCAKHAQAQRIDITLELESQPMYVLVRDDGIGFDPGQVQGARRGLGLMNMRETAEFVGGCLTIDSQPGKGTTVSLAIASVWREGGA